jgi:hypothetical protein
MKKVLLISDENNFPAGAFEFLKYLHEREPIAVTGFFYSSVNYEMLVASSLSATAAGFINEVKEQNENVERCIMHFEKECVINQMDYKVHKENDIGTMAAIKTETRFADLLLMSEELFCRSFDDVQPNNYMMEILRHMECPATLVPERFAELKKIIITYDGSKESMFALKHFTYLFPELRNTETELVFFKPDDERAIPELNYLEEYAAKHFPNLTINKLHFNAKKYFTTWLGYEKDAFVVAGSFARSAMSSVLRHSFIEEAIKENLAPLFIAHNV